MSIIHMNKSTLLPALGFAFLLLAKASADQPIGLLELMTSYAWGSAGPISGTRSLNLWNDNTGELLTADNGDLPDLTIFFTTNLGNFGGGGFEYTSSNTLRATETFSGTLSSNNPGSRITNTVTLLFASHVTITDLNADFTSLNSTGVSWETSRIAALTPTGDYFSTAPTLAPYLTHASIGGSSTSYPGFYISDGKTTVTGVGTSTTVSGTGSGALDNLTGTAGNSILDYTDLNLTAGTRIGGLEWITVLEDTRGTGNSTSSLTSTLTNLSVSGTIVPEPSLILLSGLFPFLSIIRRRH